MKDILVIGGGKIGSVVAALLADTPEATGYRVTVAENGPEAERLLRDGCAVDLMFSDIVMPGGLNGWDLSERVRLLRPAIKVLLTSGYPMNIEMAGTRPALSGDILGKPYSRAELARRVRAALDQPPTPG